MGSYNDETAEMLHGRIEYLLDAVRADIGLAALENDPHDSLDGLMLARGCLDAVRQDIYWLESFLARDAANGPQSDGDHREGQGQGCACDRCQGGEDEH